MNSGICDGSTVFSQRSTYFNRYTSKSQHYHSLMISIKALVLSAIVCCLIALSILRSVLFYALAIITSKKLHERMLNSVVGTRIRFFDLNPIGRIMNRFSMDIGALDDLLPTTLHEALTVAFLFDLACFNALTLISEISQSTPCWCLAQWPLQASSTS